MKFYTKICTLLMITTACAQVQASENLNFFDFVSQPVDKEKVTTILTEYREKESQAIENAQNNFLNEISSSSIISHDHVENEIQRTKNNCLNAIEQKYHANLSTRIAVRQQLNIAPFR